MKKTIILSVVALACSVLSVNANAKNFETSYEISAFGNTSPFHMSVVKGDLEMVKKLIDLGSDVNEKWNGLTPAMYAAKFNRTEVLQLLIDNGANLKEKSDKGLTAKKYAEISGAVEAEKLITETLSDKR